MGSGKNDGELVPPEETIEFPDNPNTLNHIFRDQPGHVLDTPENRQMLFDVANNPDNYSGRDRFGNYWYVANHPDGGQIWVKVRDGKIINGGFNLIPKPWNSSTGLDAPSHKKIE